jgi:hypothetical protein
MHFGAGGSQYHRQLLSTFIYFEVSRSANYEIHCWNNVASHRNTPKPTTSWKAVSNGPAVVAGSKPRRLEITGITVPISPAVTIEQVMAPPITIPKGTFLDQMMPMMPKVRPQTNAINKVVAVSFLIGLNKLLLLATPESTARTVMAACSPTFPDIAEMTGIKEASKMTFFSTPSKCEIDVGNVALLALLTLIKISGPISVPFGSNWTYVAIYPKNRFFICFII